MKRTEDLYREGVLNAQAERKWEIPISAPVHFRPKKVTIDPWLLGILLGDGHFVGSDVSVSNTERDIINRCSAAANCTMYERTNRVCAIFQDKGSLHYRLLDYGLQGLHSWEKFIPKEYKYNSIDVRLGILRGLIDSDGSVSGTQVTITSTSLRLIRELPVRV